MFATIPSFLSALPKTPQRSPSPTAAYSPPPSPTAAYSPPSSPSFSFASPSRSIFASPPPRSTLFPPSPPASPYRVPSARPSLFSTAPTYHAPPTYTPAHFTATSPTRHALVLNWEDVLAPTSILTDRVGLEPSYLALENARALLSQDTYLQQALASIEEQTIALLTTAARLGPVFVVTDKSLAFMEATCAVFFPRLAIFLLQANVFTSYANRIQVVAPPRHLTSPLEVASWKSMFFQSVCIDQVQHNARQAFSLIQVSATDRDALVCIGAAHRAAPSLAVPKCVAVSASQSLETFFAQLQTLNRYLDIAATHESAFSTQL